MDTDNRGEEIKNPQVKSDNLQVEANESKLVEEAKPVEEIQETADMENKTSSEQVPEQNETAETSTPVSENSTQQPSTASASPNIAVIEGDVEQHATTIAVNNVATNVEPESHLEIEYVANETAPEEVSRQNESAETGSFILEETTQQPAASSTPLNINAIHEDVKKLIEQRATSLGMDNVTINVEPGSNLGDNFMGFIGKLTVNGTDKNDVKKTFNWIIKTAPNIEIYRAALNVTVLYEREAYVYEQIFPHFKQFQSEKRVLSPFNEYPPFIFAHIECMMESIVMKDMKSIGYTMTKRQDPLGLNHVKLVMKTYGKLHAISYALRDQKPELLEKIAANTDDIFKDTMKDDATYENQNPLMQSALETLDPVKDAKAIVIFKKFAEKFVDIIKVAIRRTNKYSVIGHGDSWVNNILWKYTNSTKPTIPTNICLLDWQVCRYGSPACDLSYFLLTCTTKEFRDKHYNDMIRLYYYTLCGHVVDLGSDPEKLFPYEALQQELKASSIIGFYMSVFVLYIITRDASEMPEWRTGDANAEEIGKQWLTESTNLDKYRHRVRGVIVDAYEKGYLDCIK